VTTRNEIAAKPVVYQIPGMDTVQIRCDIPYQTADADLVMDIYRPPDLKAATRLPAVIFVIGYSDLGAEKIFGCKFKEMEEACAISTYWSDTFARTPARSESTNIGSACGPAPATFQGPSVSYAA
jgi:hypothetical protein